MQGPLTTAPWSPCVDQAAIIIEHTMPIDGSHLHGIARNPPERLPHRFFRFVQGLNHPLLVISIEGNGCLSMAAIATSSAGKNLRNKRHSIHLERKSKKTALFQEKQLGT